MLGTRCLALPLVALTLAACGSSGSSGSSGEGSGEGSGESSSGRSSPASGQLSRAELIAQADRICRDTSQRIRAQGSPTSLADVEQFLEEAADATAEGVGKLRALAPPDSVKPDYDAFLQRLDMVAEQARDVAGTAGTQDMSTVIAAIGDLAGDDASRRLARKIGFKLCRSGSGSPLPPGAAAPEIPNAPASP